MTDHLLGGGNALSEAQAKDDVVEATLEKIDELIHPIDLCRALGFANEAPELGFAQAIVVEDFLLLLELKLISI
jgi:hypothetical protein